MTRQTPQLKPSYVITTGFTYTHPFKIGDTELRDRFERALECSKLDGTLATLYKKWFGEDAPANEAALRVIVGSGEPGLAGYDPTPRPISCSK